MQPNRTPRRLTLAIILLALVVAPMVLTVTLSSVEFKSSRGEFPRFTFFDLAYIEEGEEVEEELGRTPDNSRDSEVPKDNFWSLVVVGGAILLLAMTTKSGRQAVLISGVRFALIAFVVYFVRGSVLSVLTALGIFGLSGGIAGGTGNGPSMPPAFILLVSAPLALGITYIGWRLYLRRQVVEEDPSAAFIDEVQATLDRLDAGASLRETVLDCYRSMLQLAQHQRLIKVMGSATTMELEERLVKVGLPERETGRLTRLFEQVRYGQHEASERERLEARDCLVAFIDATTATYSKAVVTS